MTSTENICPQANNSTLQSTPVGATSAQHIPSIISEIRDTYPYITRLRIVPKRKGRKFVGHLHVGSTIYLTMYAPTLSEMRRSLVRASRKHLRLHLDRYNVELS